MPQRSDNPPRSKVTQPAAHTTQAGEKPGRLLVGDDEPRLLASLCSILREQGFDVDGVSNGDALCRQVGLNHYDLILLNICMPGMGGLDVLSWLNANKMDIPVVMISGIADFRTLRRALQYGAFDYLRKPYDVDELIRVVREGVRVRTRESTGNKAEQSRNPTAHFFPKMLNQLPDIVFSLDDRGRINFVNRRVEPLLGFEQQELLGKPFSLLIDEGDVAKVSSLLDKHSLGDPATLEIRLRKRDQASSPFFELTVVPTRDQELWLPDNEGHLSIHAELLAVARDITERKKKQALVEFQASHDALTGLPNRTLFLDRLALAISQASRTEQKLASLFIDLNDFKAVNDTFGHNMGDQLLKSVAVRLKGCLREGDTLARYGGDEFTVLLPGLESGKDADAVVVKLLESLKDPFRLNNGTLCLSVKASIGVALFPDEGLEADELLQRADEAMYAKKERIKSR
ncbi:diguanylate cyclase domain-containing protein [Marinobacter guineae]|uniref:diguanylate cyclase domain-containing protein n=1 Tax=Marinobacter guineae TaxID=432303 RepID=UPI0014756208|nr:diguanylate cyclase [Marinobacter guineae]